MVSCPAGGDWGGLMVSCAAGGDWGGLMVSCAAGGDWGGLMVSCAAGGDWGGLTLVGVGQAVSIHRHGTGMAQQQSDRLVIERFGGLRDGRSSGRVSSPGSAFCADSNFGDGCVVRLSNK